MRLKKYLKERYYKGYKVKSWGRERYVEVFVNPSRKELDEIAGQSSWEQGMHGVKNVRFFIDNKNKKVYAWTPEETHYDMSGFIFGSNYGWITPYIVSGIASKRGGKYIMVDSDQPIGIQLKWSILDLDWAQKYISTDRYLKG